MAERLIFLGGGGHAEVVVRLLATHIEPHSSCPRALAGLCDIVVVGAAAPFVDDLALIVGSRLASPPRISIASDEEMLAAIAAASDVDFILVNGVGRSDRAGDLACAEHEPAAIRVVRAYETAGASRLIAPSLVHPSAILVDDLFADGDGLRAAVGPGSVSGGAQLHAGAVLGARSVVGRHAVLNTRSSVDHDCRIDAHAFVGPGATLCGGVHVGEGAFVGAGATILPAVAIGANAIVPAGAVVDRPVAPGTVAVSREIRRGGIT